MKENVTLKDAYGIHIVFFFVVAAFILWLRTDIFIEYAGEHYIVNYSTIDERLLPENANTYYETDPVNIPLVIYKYVYNNIGYIYTVGLSFLIGLASVVIFYFFAAQILSNKSAALLSSLVLFIQSPHILLSKALSPEIMTFFIFVTALFLGAKAYALKEKYMFYLVPAILLYLTATIANLSLIMPLPGFIAIFFIRSRKLGILVLSLSFALLASHFIYYEFEFSRFLSAISPGVEDEDLRAVLIGAGKAVFLPLIMAFSVYGYCSRLGISKNLLTGLLLLSGPFIYLSFVSDWHSLQAKALYAVALIAPGAGLLLKQFSFMDKEFRNAAMILLISMAILAYYMN